MYSTVRPVGPESPIKRARAASLAAAARSSEPTAAPVTEPYLSITEVARLLNDIFEVQFPQLLFRGEISQLQVAQSGHLYFTIKDEGAQMSCVMWAGVARTLQFKPQAGVKVRCHARPNIYPQSGRFQMVVHRMTPDGEGELQRKFLELKARLEQDGFFAAERKRPLPFLPRAVGLVTSKTGAVIHDMMVKIRERFPSMIVYLVDTRVQGDGAAAEIAAALRQLDAARLVDVIIVARGGGSLEDLWAFNEDEVVKAVFGCSVPVVSGVGHEVDVTLCDLAADVRAPTPTAAAEMVVPRSSDLMARLEEFERRLADTDRWFQPRVQRLDDLSMRLELKLVSVFEESKLRLKAAESSLSTIKPDRVIALLQSRVDLLASRLGRAGGTSLHDLLRQLAEFRERLERVVSPSTLTNRLTLVEALAFRLESAANRTVQQTSANLANLETRMHSVSPERVLERGYGILKVGDRYVRSVKQLSKGDAVEISLQDGVVSSTVSETKEGSIWRNQ